MNDFADRRSPSDFMNGVVTSGIARIESDSAIDRHLASA